MPHRSRSSSAPRMEGLRPWPPLCELRKRSMSRLPLTGPRSGGGIRNGLNTGCGLIQRCSLPQAQTTTAEISGNQGTSLDVMAPGKTGKIKDLGQVCMSSLGLFYFQYLSLYINQFLAEQRLVGIWLVSAYPRSGIRAQVNKPRRRVASGISAGRGWWPWLTFRRSRDKE